MALLCAVRARHAMIPPNTSATASRPLMTNSRAPRGCLEPGGLGMRAEPGRLSRPGERALQSGARLGAMHFRRRECVLQLNAFAGELLEFLLVTRHRSAQRSEPIAYGGALAAA